MDIKRNNGKGNINPKLRKLNNKVPSIKKLVSSTAANEIYQKMEKVLIYSFIYISKRLSWFIASSSRQSETLHAISNKKTTN
jgi:hypothetical protein